MSGVIVIVLCVEQSLVESTMGKDVMREAFWDPANPNRLALTLRGGVKVILLVLWY